MRERERVKSDQGKLNNLGFTLIELLVVISIIGFLATASMVVFNSARLKAKQARCRADLKQILTAIDVKRDEYNKVLLGVTGSGCSDCSCRPFDEITLNSSACINRMTTTFQNLGFSGALRDPWGVFYMIDENENEGGGSNCTRDSLRSLNCGSVPVPFYICN